MYAKAKVGGFLHLAIGEEATIVGAVRAMRDEDYLISTYRSHGHALARGTDPNRVMAELFGREDGVSRGRGGSMHMFDLEKRFMGGYGIVGGNLPLAAGMALVLRLPRHRGGHGLRVRRRRRQPGHVRRDAQPRRALEAAGRLHGDQQPVRHGHGARAPLGGHRPAPPRRRLRRPGHALRRHGRGRDPPRDGRGDPRARARSASRCSSRPSPTASAATRWPTPRSTAPRSRSPSGASATRSRRSRERLSRRACSRRARPRSSTRRRSSASTRRSRSPTSSAFPPPESLYDHVYVLGDQVRGWYSVDERAAGVRRGEDLRERRRGARAGGGLRRGAQAGREGGRRPRQGADEAQAEEDDAEEAEKTRRTS